MPAPDRAAELLHRVGPDDGPLREVLAAELSRMSGERVTPDAWDAVDLPGHLRPRFRVVEKGASARRGRRPARARTAAAGPRALHRGRQRPRPGARADCTSWTIGTLPQVVETMVDGLTVRGLPGADRHRRLGRRAHPGLARAATGAALERCPSPARLATRPSGAGGAEAHRRPGAVGPDRGTARHGHRRHRGRAATACSTRSCSTPAGHRSTPRASTRSSGARGSATWPTWWRSWRRWPTSSSTPDGCGTGWLSRRPRRGRPRSTTSPRSCTRLVFDGFVVGHRHRPRRPPPALPRRHRPPARQAPRVTGT